MTSPDLTAVNPDQAHLLRNLMERRAEAAEPAAHGGLRRSAASVAIASGKGGVGKSVLALNIAVAMQLAGHRVGLLDANLSLGNIDLLCGLNGYWNLSHVITGARRLPEIVLAGPAGVSVVPGASGLDEMADYSLSAQRDVLSQLEEFAAGFDCLIIDTATGVHRAVRQFVTAADVACVIAGPEPTAIADTYAAIKLLSSSETGPVVQTIVNQTVDPGQARDVAARLEQTSRRFLHTSLPVLGSVPWDPAVPRSVYSRRPFVLEAPAAAASRAVVDLAHRLSTVLERQPDRGGYFQQFRRRLGAAA
jgi:flagellar biosynthesis protein FlhG